MSVRVTVCVCVRERERERERLGWVYVCALGRRLYGVGVEADMMKTVIILVPSM